jgi:hypothetical protein
MTPSFIARNNIYSFAGAHNSFCSKYSLGNLRTLTALNFMPHTEVAIIFLAVHEASSCFSRNP